MPTAPGTLRYMDWKLIVGQPSDKAYSSDCLCDLDEDGGIVCTDCDLPPAQVEWMGWPVRLYNITGDLKESHDLAAANRDVVSQLIAKIQKYNDTAGRCSNHGNIYLSRKDAVGFPASCFALSPSLLFSCCSACILSSSGSCICSFQARRDYIPVAVERSSQALPLSSQTSRGITIRAKW